MNKDRLKDNIYYLMLVNMASHNIYFFGLDVYIIMVLLSLVEGVVAKGGFLDNIPSELVSYGRQIEVLNDYQLDNTNTFLSDLGGALVGAISSSIL